MTKTHHTHEAHPAPATTIPARPQGDQAAPAGGEQIVVGGGPYREDMERGHPRHLRHEAIRMANEEMADKIAGASPGKSANVETQREAAANINPRETVDDYVELEPVSGKTPVLGSTPLQPVLNKTQEEAEAEAKEEYQAGIAQASAPPPPPLAAGVDAEAVDAQTESKKETAKADADQKAKDDAAKKKAADAKKGK